MSSMGLTPRQKAEFQFTDVYIVIGLLNELAEAEPHLNQAGADVMSMYVAQGISHLFGLICDFEVAFKHALDAAEASPTA